MKTNTTNTTLATLTNRITAIHTADEAHELWIEAKRDLSREDSLAFWALLKEQRGANDFSGKPWRKAHPDAPAEAPAWVKAPNPEKHPIAAPKAPAKQEKAPVKAKAKAAPAKQEKAPAKAKEPTQKQMLATILVTLDSMDKSLKALDKRVAKLEKSAR